MADLTGNSDFGSGSDFGSTIDSVSGRTHALARSAERFATAMVKAFTSSSAHGKQFDTVLKSLGVRLAELAAKMVLPTIKGGTPVLSATSGDVQPFAIGGVIAAPTYFPLAGGRIGLAGEAGAEAILPLARGSDGRLGVASGSAAAANVTVNIATPDAASFRRSDSYIAGQIARAVARGQRVL